MPINIGNKKVKDIYFGGKRVSRVYKGSSLVYSSYVEYKDLSVTVKSDKKATLDGSDFIYIEPNKKYSIWIGTPAFLDPAGNYTVAAGLSLVGEIPPRTWFEFTTPDTFSAGKVLWFGYDTQETPPIDNFGDLVTVRLREV